LPSTMRQIVIPVIDTLVPVAQKAAIETSERNRNHGQTIRVGHSRAGCEFERP
jgi:hypothetical protein